MTAQPEPSVITGRGSWAYCRAAILRHVEHCAQRVTATGADPHTHPDLDLMQAKGDARAFGWSDTDITNAVRAGVLDHLRDVLA